MVACKLGPPGALRWQQTDLEAPLLRGKVAAASPVEDAAAFVGVEVGNSPQQTRFPGARWPGKTRTLAKVQIEADGPEPVGANLVYLKKLWF